VWLPHRETTALVAATQALTASMGDLLAALVDVEASPRKSETSKMPTHPTIQGADSVASTLGSAVGNGQAQLVGKPEPRRLRSLR
jgi:hypothetical protein